MVRKIPPQDVTWGGCAETLALPSAVAQQYMAVPNEQQTILPHQISSLSRALQVLSLGDDVVKYKSGENVKQGINHLRETLEATDIDGAHGPEREQLRLDIEYLNQALDAINISEGSDDWEEVIKEEEIMIPHADDVLVHLAARLAEREKDDNTLERWLRKAQRRFAGRPVRKIQIRRQHENLHYIEEDDELHHQKHRQLRGKKSSSLHKSVGRKGRLAGYELQADGPQNMSAAAVFGYQRQVLRRRLDKYRSIKDSRRADRRRHKHEFGNEHDAISADEASAG